MFQTLLDETGGTRSSHFLLPPFSLFGTNARFLEMQLWSIPLLSSAMHTTYAQNTERNGLTPYLRIPHSTMCPQCVRHENLWEWIVLTKYFLKWTCVWIVATAMLKSFNENCSRLGTWIIVMMWKNKYKIAELRVGYCKGRRIFWSNRQKIIGLGQFCVSIRFAFVPGYHTALRGHGTNDKRSQPSPLAVNYRICWHPTVPTMFFFNGRHGLHARCCKQYHIPLRMTCQLSEYCTKRLFWIWSIPWSSKYKNYVFTSLRLLAYGKKRVYRTLQNINNRRCTTFHVQPVYFCVTPFRAQSSLQGDAMITLGLVPTLFSCLMGGHVWSLKLCLFCLFRCRSGC